ncbi:MAG: acyltransferase [Acutalibacteraceae bacterium]
METSKRKKVYFEYMRIVAVVLVLFNHTPGYTLYMTSSGLEQALYMIITMITRINVPLFLMISGALLLPKEEDFKTVFNKRIIRLAIVLLLISLGLYSMQYFISGNYYGQFDVIQFIYSLISGDIDGTYWYLYAYLGFLFLLPFMQRIAHKMNKQDFYMLIVMHFILISLVPIINVILSIAGKPGIKVSENFYIPMAVSKAFFYPLLGYYLDNFIDVSKIGRKKLTGISLVAMIGILLSCLCTMYEGQTSGQYTQNYVQLFDYITTIAAFIFIKRIVLVTVPSLSRGKIASAVCKIGSLTFGIYLFDPYIKLLFYYKYFSELLPPMTPVFIKSVLWCIFSVAVCGMITYLLKKIPFVNKLI